MRSEHWHSNPANRKISPIDYAIFLPSSDMTVWDKDYNSFKKYLTPAVMKTQQGLVYEDNGVMNWWCTPSARGHAQLDTSTLIRNPQQLAGIWRSVCHRVIDFTDSASYLTHQLYRDNKITSENKDDDSFVSFSDKQFKLFVREKDQEDFKTLLSARYALESGRYLMLYKVLKSAAGISQIGIDAEGRLIICYVTVMERKVPGRYITYQAVMEQIIFEKVS